MIENSWLAMYARIHDYINAVIKETILTLVIAILPHYTCADNVFILIVFLQVFGVISYIN